MDTQGIVTGSGTRRGLSKKTRRLLTPVVIIAVLIGGYFAYGFINDRLVQYFADRAAKNCVKGSPGKIEKAYYRLHESSDLKAKRAEQAGICYSLLVDTKDAGWWYRRAVEEYKKSGNTKKLYEVTPIADSFDIFNSIPHNAALPKGVTEDQGKQGLGSQ